MGAALTKDGIPLTVSSYPFYYPQLATRALLRCLGFELSSAEKEAKKTNAESISEVSIYKEGERTSFEFLEESSMLGGIQTRDVVLNTSRAQRIDPGRDPQHN